MTLIEFLLARIAEDEESAYANVEPPRGQAPRAEAHPLVLGARRVLAECESKRRLMVMAMDEFDDESHRASLRVLRLLALSYSDHSDYQQEWAI